MRIYTDGVFDLFHRGHIECFKYIKNKYPNSELIIGVVSDKDCESYKRIPIICEEDRLEIIKSIKYIDNVIFPCPLLISEEFMKVNKFDLVMHGFSDKNDVEVQSKFFKVALDLNMFESMPYYQESSTTDIIERVKNGG